LCGLTRCRLPESAGPKYLQPMKVLRILLMVASVGGALFLLGLLKIHSKTMNMDEALLFLGLAAFLVLNVIFLIAISPSVLPKWRVFSFVSNWMDAKEAKWKRGKSTPSD
jgi:hypothetical protein